MAVLPSRTHQRLLAEARLLVCFRAHPMKAESMVQLFLEDTVPRYHAEDLLASAHGAG